MNVSCFDCVALSSQWWLKFDESVIPVRQWGRKTIRMKKKKKTFIHCFVFSFIITRQFKDQTPPKTEKKKKFFLSFSSKWLGTLEATWPPNVQCRSHPENKIKLGNGLPSSQPAGPAQFLFLSFYDISLNLSWYLSVWMSRIIFLFFFFFKTPSITASLFLFIWFHSV